MRDDLFVVPVLPELRMAQEPYLHVRTRLSVSLLADTVYSPGLLNSLAGVVSTLVNIYGAQHGEFSVTSKITLIVTSSVALICGVLTLWYSFVKLRGVKRKHDLEIGRGRAGRHGEGFIEEIKRKAREPELPETI